jgi:hypothetical protein
MRSQLNRPHTLVAFVALSVGLSSCARPPGEKNERSDAGVEPRLAPGERREAPTLNAAELRRQTQFEHERDRYVKRRLAELPHIDERIRALEVDETLERGRRQQDSRDIVPRLRDARARYEQELHRAETATPAEYPALKQEIDDLDFELETYLRKPAP